MNDFLSERCWEITKDTQIKNSERFKGKKVVRVGVGDTIKKALALMKKLKTLV